MKKSLLTDKILTEILSKVLNGEGLITESPSKGNFIKTIISKEIDVNITFKLTNKRPPYNFLEGVGIEHKNISRAINEILNKASINFEWKCSAGTHVRNYWLPQAPLTISSIEDVDGFVEYYNEAFILLEKDFLDKYKNVDELIHDSTLFYTKWPKGMMAPDVGFTLIGHGILAGDKKYILCGKDLLTKKKDTLTGLPKIWHDAMLFLINYADKY